MDNLVTFSVDGRELRAQKGALLWEVCRSEGIDIPIFCYHTKLGAVGACRTCLVELEGAKGPITACSTPVTDGMVVRTKSPVAQKAQRGIFEFLLANHPLDCPICDRGGECPLQDQTFAYGPGSSRYIEPKRHHVKPIALGPTIALDRERCVLCWRCVRFCADIAEDASIVLLDRGDHTVVGTAQDKQYVSNFSGNVVELCPVGALTSRKQRFNFRPWELQNRPSICPHCPVGCNINVSVRKNDQVIRFLSRDNPEVDDSWLCDRGRFGVDFINDPDRLKAPMIRKDGAFVQTSWSEALDFIATRLHAIIAESGPQAVGGIASPRLTNEDLFVFRRFMRDVVGTRAVDHFPRAAVAATNQAEPERVVLDRQLMPIHRLESARTILLFAADPSMREPVLELRIRKAVNDKGAKLVVVCTDEIPLLSKAHASLACAPADLADTARALAAAVKGIRDGTRTDSNDVSQAGSIVSNFLTEGPVAVLYDDVFDGVVDKRDLLDALGTLVVALSDGGEVGTLPMLDDCNSMGARDLAVLPEHDGDVAATAVIDRLRDPDDTLAAIFLLGADVVGSPRGEVVAERLRAMDLVVVNELRMTETAQLADVILPAASFAEKAGTFTNTERRVQLIAQCVPPPGIARSDWEMLVDLSQSFEDSLDYATTDEIWDDIRQQVPAYADLSLMDIGPWGVRPEVPQFV